MIRFRNFLPLAAALAGAATLGAPTPARASYTVSIYDDNNLVSAGIAVIVSGNSLIFSGSTPDFSLAQGSGASNNPGTQAGTNLSLGSTDQITTNFGTSGGTHTITIVLSQTGFTAPVGSPLASSSSTSGGSVAGLGGSVTVAASYQGYVDNSGNPYSAPAVFAAPGGTPTPLISGSASVSGTGTAPLVLLPGTTQAMPPGGIPFTITDVMKFVFTVGAGSGQETATLSGSTVVSTAPEPSTLVAALASSPLLGIGIWLRRRRNAA